MNRGQCTRIICLGDYNKTYPKCGWCKEVEECKRVSKEREMSWSFEKVLCPKCRSRVYARPRKKDNYPEFTCLRCGWSDNSEKERE